MSAPMNIHHRRTPSNYYAPQPTHARSLSGQFGSSWSDAFEFSSQSPLNSALHLGASSPPMGSVHLPSSYTSMGMSTLGLTTTSTFAPLSMSCSPGNTQKDYFSFERDYCSNFACCGITLPDMHALVAHFEETHLNAAENAPFTTPITAEPSFPVDAAQPPSSRSVPQINTTNTGLTAPGIMPGDAPSPHSSVGPETPPPASHVSTFGFPQPQLQVQTQIYGSRANSASPYPHSSYAASPLSAGSPASSGAEHSDNSQSGSQGAELDMDIDMDIMMHFDPLDGGAHTPLDSTPPSPLAHPVRPASVLRAAALKNSGASDAPPVGFPPALFSAPALLSSAEARKDKKEKKEKRSRAASPALDVGNSSSGGNGGAIRREKIRKTASGMSSLLGVGSTSRSSLSSASSDEPSNAAENCEKAGKDGAEKAGEEAKEKSTRPERSERIGRPERSDKSGKRTREKAYKCTKPGCTKSYLNPNGLKYHLAKGTCTFAVGSGPPTPVTPTTPSVPHSSNTVSTEANSSEAAAAAPSNPQPMTPLTPSTYHNGNANMYEYQIQQQQVGSNVSMITPPAPPTMHMYAPGMAQAY